MSKEIRSNESAQEYLERVHPRGKLQMKRPTDPLIRQMTAAYKASKRYQYDQLMKERSKWSRRETIARNKLAAIQEELDDLLYPLVDEAEKGGVK